MEGGASKCKLQGKTTSTLLRKALGTGEVDALCRKALYGVKGGVKFLGVGAAHSLPKISTLAKERGRSCCFVANTQTKEKDGEHWVAFYFPPAGRGTPFIFDSYARTPKDMGHPDWAQYMTIATSERGGGDRWDRQHRVVQDQDSSLCGVLCAYYLWHVVRHLNPFPHGSRVVPLCKLKSFVSHIKDLKT